MTTTTSTWKAFRRETAAINDGCRVPCEDCGVRRRQMFLDTRKAVWLCPECHAKQQDRARRAANQKPA